MCVNDSIRTKRQGSVTIGPFRGSGPYITLCNTLTLIVVECAPMGFTVIAAHTIHCYCVICMLAAYISAYASSEYLIG